SFPTTFASNVGVSHIGVDINRLTDFKRHRIVEFGMQHYSTLQNVSIFFPGMADEIPKFLKAFDSQPRQHRHHAFSARVRPELMVVVIARLSAPGIRE